MKALILTALMLGAELHALGDPLPVPYCRCLWRFAVDCTATCTQITMTQTCNRGASWFPTIPAMQKSAANQPWVRLGCELIQFSTITC